MLYVTFSNIACLLGYQNTILIQFGWIVSWFYLRFIKLNEGGEFRGDRSETFAFASWFPPFAQYVRRPFPVLPSPTPLLSSLLLAPDETITNTFVRPAFAGSTSAK